MHLKDLNTDIPDATYSKDSSIQEIILLSL